MLAVRRCRTIGAVLVGLAVVTGQVASYANTAVVDELQARHTPATFFLAGKWVERYPDLTRRIAADPDFEIASHSYAHRGFAANCYRLDPEPATDMAADVEHSFAVLAPFGGRQTRYFRFPGGCYDTAALRAVAATHATVIQYDDVADDPFNDNTAAIITPARPRRRDRRPAHHAGERPVHRGRPPRDHRRPAIPRLPAGRPLRPAHRPTRALTAREASRAGLASVRFPGDGCGRARAAPSRLPRAGRRR